MPFYIRKSVSVGPFRLNLSKSGLGLSAGITGLRFGTGPSGNYVHMGRGGIYYRKTLGSKSPSRLNPRPPELVPGVVEAPLQPGEEAIESASVLQMVPATAKDLLDQVNAAKERLAIWPWIAAPGALATALTWLSGMKQVPVGIAAVTGVVVLACRWWEKPRRNVVLMYDIEEGRKQAYEKLVDAFTNLQKTTAWHVSATSAVHDGRRNANATSNIRRHAITPAIGTPKWIVTNIDTPAIPVGRQKIYFFPDRILFESPEGLGAIEYDELNLEVVPSYFIEDDRPPSDAKIVDYRWQFTNRDGSRDKRFNNNRELPVCEYRDLLFTSPSGLNERVMVSRIGVPEVFAEALKQVANEASGNAGRP